MHRPSNSPAHNSYGGPHLSLDGWGRGGAASQASLLPSPVSIRQRRTGGKAERVHQHTMLAQAHCHALSTFHHNDKPCLLLATAGNWLHWFPIGHVYHVTFCTQLNSNSITHLWWLRHRATPCSSWIGQWGRHSCEHEPNEEVEGQQSWWRARGGTRCPCSCQ
jgi:hypothetical protein